VGHPVVFTVVEVSPSGDQVVHNQRTQANDVTGSPELDPETWNRDLLTRHGISRLHQGQGPNNDVIRGTVASPVYNKLMSSCEQPKKTTPTTATTHGKKLQ